MVGVGQWDSMTADKTPTVSKRSDRPPLDVDFALQGGGAHGAFTWGVLDRLLEEKWLRIDGISGTSAGAMNAAVLASAYAAGGAERARSALEAFWRSVSRAAVLSPFQRGPIDILLNRWTLDSSPLFIAMDLMARLVSPYDLTPFGGNPLASLLNESVDFRGAGGWTDQGIRDRDQCAHGTWQGVPKPRNHAGGAVGIGLSAVAVPGRRDRRRGVLGWRLRRQSHHHAAGAGMHLARHDSDPAEPDRAARARRAPRATS